MVLAAITMTQGWMLGIMGMMCLFGVAAAIFNAKGKERQE